MSSNYGYDANGWEREPFPARDEFIEPRRSLARRLVPTEAHRNAKAAHPTCADCAVGRGYIVPGPGHCETHDKHCSSELCW